MRILLSNDDGYFAPGLAFLAAALADLAGITVVAPERDRSGASNSLTLDRPLSVRRSANGFLFVNGTPTDCVHLAVTGLLEELPDMVVSGINLGANMGDDTIYSGTVAAATEGYLLGIPSIAVSLASKAGRHFDTAARVVREMVERFARRPRAGPVLLNVNVPDLPARCAEGARNHAPRQAPQGRTGGQDNQPARAKPSTGSVPPASAQDAGPGTDFNAVAANRVSVTPLQIDLTHLQQISAPARMARSNERRSARTARHRHDLAAHARAHGRAPAQGGHRRRDGAGGDGRGAAPPVRR